MHSTISFDLYVWLYVCLHMHIYFIYVTFSPCLSKRDTHRQTDRQTDRMRCTDTLAAAADRLRRTARDTVRHTCILKQCIIVYLLHSVIIWRLTISYPWTSVTSTGTFNRNNQRWRCESLWRVLSNCMSTKSGLASFSRLWSREKGSQIRQCCPEARIGL